jgi:hypothetical protein
MGDSFVIHLGSPSTVPPHYSSRRATDAADLARRMERHDSFRTVR